MLLGERIIPTDSFSVKTRSKENRANGAFSDICHLQGLGFARRPIRRRRIVSRMPRRVARVNPALLCADSEFASSITCKGVRRVTPFDGRIPAQSMIFAGRGTALPHHDRRKEGSLGRRSLPKSHCKQTLQSPGNEKGAFGRHPIERQTYSDFALIFFSQIERS